MTENCAECLESARLLGMSGSREAKLLAEIERLKDMRRISIPTDTMEMEFQAYYRRGYEAGRKSVSLDEMAKASEDAGLYDEPTAVTQPIRKADLYQRHCDKCGKSGWATIPPGSGKFYCGFECAE